MGSNHEEARSSGEYGVNNDMYMGNVIHSISPDKKLKEKAYLWEHTYTKKKHKNWNDDIMKHCLRRGSNMELSSLLTKESSRNGRTYAIDTGYDIWFIRERCRWVTMGLEQSDEAR